MMDRKDVVREYESYLWQISEAQHFHFMKLNDISVSINQLQTYAKLKSYLGRG
jgi:hypothetical protein